MTPNSNSNSLPQALDRLEAKIDRLDTRLDSVDITLARQEASLAEHIRRCDALEDQNNLTRAQLQPVIDHVSGIRGAGKLVVFVGALVALIVGALKVSEYIP